MQWLLQLVLLVGIPYIIRTLSNWKKSTIKTKQQYRMEQWQKSKGSSLVATVLLLLALSSYGYLILHPQESKFSQIGLTSNARTFQIRNNLREYLADKKPSNKAFELNSMDTVSRSEIKNEYDEYKVWYELMKNKNQKTLYTSYGDAVYCEFCKDDMDYAFYYAPSVLKCYLGIFVLIGLVSMTFQKAQWRYSATIFAASVLSCEMSLIFMSKELLDALQYTYNWDKADQARHVMFFILAVAMLVKNRPNMTKDDIEQVHCDELESLSVKAFKAAKIIQLKQQVDIGTGMGPTHPEKKELLQQLLIEREI